jgi:hypothetical protein
MEVARLPPILQAAASPAQVDRVLVIAITAVFPLALYDLY